MATSETIGVQIPADQIAKVIGKAGAGLKQIREASGCKLQVHQAAESTGGLRRVDIIGQPEQIVGGFHALIGKAFPDGNANPTLLIPAEKAGQVVGKRGDNLKRVREECRVRLTLERDPVTDPASGVQERSLTMQGEMGQMARALRFILGPAAGGFSVKPALPAALPALTAGPHQGVTQVRAPSNDPDEVQLQFTVPDKFAGAILGKAGAQVKQTAATAGCKVSMTTRGQGADRRAVIMGTYSKAMVAQGMLFEQLMEAARAAGTEINEVVVTFLVRKEAAGAVIGKQGATLKQIREASGAKIQLAREEVESQRPCALSGSLQSVMHAEKSIFDLVRQVPVSPDGSTAYSGGVLVASPYTGGGSYNLDAGANKRSDQAVHTPSAKRQRVDDSEASTKLLVPAQCAGAVIGKAGSGLKEIRETTGAHVDMMQQAQAPQWPTDRVVTLKGNAAARQAAVLAILRMAYQQNRDSTCTLKFLVTGQQAGILIGEQGNTLKYIREQCGVSVQVERKEVFGERLVTATGAQGVVSSAAITICTILDNAGVAPKEALQQQPAAAQQPAMAEYQAYPATALPSPGAYVQ